MQSDWIKELFELIVCRLWSQIQMMTQWPSRLLVFVDGWCALAWKAVGGRVRALVLRLWAWRGSDPLISPASEVRTELSDWGTCSREKGDGSVWIKHTLTLRSLHIKLGNIQTDVDALWSSGHTSFLTLFLRLRHHPFVHVYSVSWFSGSQCDTGSWTFPFPVCLSALLQQTSGNARLHYSTALRVKETFLLFLPKYG